MSVLLCAVISAAFTFMGRVGAQEVKFIDLTSAEPKITIRTPPSSGQQVKRNPDGSYTIQGFSQAVVIGDCGVGANDPHALKATVTWIDRLSYAEGDFMEWEVEIMNVGTVPMTLAASPNLSNLQPLDASVPFSYEETGVTLSVRTEYGCTDLAHVSIYGSDAQPDTIVVLKVGEWARLRARSKVELPRIGTDQTLHGEAVARFWLRHGEVTPAPGTYGTRLMNQCPRASDGPGPQMEIVRKKSAN